VPAKELAQDELDNMTYEELVDLIEGYFGVDPLEDGGHPTKEDLIRSLRQFAS
jgi:hypothetical protein